MKMAFDPEWAPSSDWAYEYRRCGLQVVPAHAPDPRNPGFSFKRPALSHWTEFQETLTPDQAFDRWYGPQGEYTRSPQMGMLTGRCSGNVGVIDLDTYKQPESAGWWEGLLLEHNNGMEPETVEQRTGGGGLQKLFRFPAGYVIPTNKTDIGVDIRGQGGFAMLPPSKHISGQAYDWLPGKGPHEVDIADAPDWLIDAVEELVERHGGARGAANGHVERKASVGDFDDFGRRIDGREQEMRDIALAALIGFCGQNGTSPTAAELFEEAWPVYARNNDTSTPGRDERAFAYKCAYTVRRFNAGAIAKCKTIDDALESYNAREQAVEVAREQEARAIGPSGRLLLTAAEFLSLYTPPSYVIDGIFQQGYLYSLTAPTGHGKTAVAMYMAQCVARGVKFHTHDVKQGDVLFLAGENPHDIMARYLVLADKMDFDPTSANFHFINGVINVEQSLERIRADAATIPNLKLVIVDTAAAYFSGDEDNSNTQKGDFARSLRQLTFLPGKPCVIVNCHPPKGAQRDGLLPVGGGAFVNEVDGNATLWKNAEETTQMHWFHKFRGPDFEPITFRLDTVTSDYVRDDAGRHMPSVIAKSIGVMELEMAEQKTHSDENVLLAIIRSNPGAALRRLAEAGGWKTPKGEPSIGKVRGACRRLKGEKLISEVRGKFRITPKGRRELGETTGGDDDE